MIVGLVSSYREGNLVTGAVRSLLPAVDCVKVLDAPVEGATHEGPPSNFRPFQRNHAVDVQSYAQPFADDAAKRTWLLKWAQKKKAEWAVIVDGDEILLWGEHVPAWIERADLEGDDGEPVAGVPLRLVELDGSAAMLQTRILRPALFESYAISSHVLVTKAGQRVALPNAQICISGGHPLTPPFELDPHSEDGLRWLAYHRTPLQGEPHLLHRSLWRHTARTVERQHVAEARTLVEKPELWTP